MIMNKKNEYNHRWTNYLSVLRDAVKSLGQKWNRMDAALVAEEREGEASDGVADSPGSVTLEMNNLIRTVDHRFPCGLQHLWRQIDVVLLQRADDRYPTDIDARPERDWAVSVFPDHVSLRIDQVIKVRRRSDYVCKKQNILVEMWILSSYLIKEKNVLIYFFRKYFFIGYL